MVLVQMNFISFFGFFLCTLHLRSTFTDYDTPERLLGSHGALHYGVWRGSTCLFMKSLSNIMTWAAFASVCPAFRNTGVFVFSTQRSFSTLKD